MEYKKMTDEQIKELRETAYGMSVANLNPADVEDYMAIATACARMESRRALQATVPQTAEPVQG